jgi:hypothetical protein
LRTSVPGAPLSHGALSVLKRKQVTAQERRRDSPAPARRDLRLAAQRLTSLGQDTFTGQQLLDEVAASGARWAPLTLRELLSSEASDPHGALLRLRPALYALRSCRAPGEVIASEAPVHAGDAVHRAMLELSALGSAAVTTRDIQEHLAARGMPYTLRAIRDGLLRLRRAEPPFVDAGRARTYRLLRASPPLAGP